MSNIKVGIIGLGFVGDAIRQAYTIKQQLHRLETFDINNDRNPTCNSLEELLNKVDFVYICVPTPMNSVGKCDTSIVESLVSSIDKISTNKIIIIKSTVAPGTTENFQNLYLNNRLVFCPEFLTEANYIKDYMNQDLMVIGCNDIDTFNAVSTEQVSVIESVKNVHFTTPTIAELHKYTANVFLATKVSFANEMASICEQVGIDWNLLVDSIKQDSRLGTTHWKVPGPDGHRGFGGTCFPKDISALITFAEELGVNTPVLNAVWNRNCTIDRPEKDWEFLKGRAVST